ncbi:20381_t:CDS:2 [Entrophospora sp. SA101]|nr:20381_t:CDS:2 [Entrophospora sp. SA101]
MLNPIIPAQPPAASRIVKILPIIMYRPFILWGSCTLLSPAITLRALTPSFNILKLHGVSCPTAKSLHHRHGENRGKSKYVKATLKIVKAQQDIPKIPYGNP